MKHITIYALIALSINIFTIMAQDKIKQTAVRIGNRVYANKIQLDKWIAHNSGNKVEKKRTIHRRIKREESSIGMQMTM